MLGDMIPPNSGGFVCSLRDFRISDAQCLGLSLGNKQEHKVRGGAFEGNS